MDAYAESVKYFREENDGKLPSLKSLKKRKEMVWQQEKTISLKDGMMPRKMQLSFRLKKMNKVPSRLKSVQLDITSTWSYNTSKWT